MGLEEDKAIDGRGADANQVVSELNNIHLSDTGRLGRILGPIDATQQLAPFHTVVGHYSGVSIPVPVGSDREKITARIYGQVRGKEFNSCQFKISFCGLGTRAMILQTLRAEHRRGGCIGRG